MKRELFHSCYVGPGTFEDNGPKYPASWTILFLAFRVPVVWLSVQLQYQPQDFLVSWQTLDHSLKRFNVQQQKRATNWLCICKSVPSDNYTNFQIQFHFSKTGRCYSTRSQSQDGEHKVTFESSLDGREKKTRNDLVNNKIPE
jgi:hypothetical protein